MPIVRNLFVLGVIALVFSNFFRSPAPAASGVRPELDLHQPAVLKTATFASG